VQALAHAIYKFTGKCLLTELTKHLTILQHVLQISAGKKYL